MKNNIDEDIEKIKRLKLIQVTGKFNSGEYFHVPIPQEYLKSIENVLSELETQINNTHILQSQLDIANAEKIEWKKIAEKLADEVEKLHTFLVNEYGTWQEDYVIENDINTNKQCIIDWAKSEVLKNENGNDKTSN